MQEFHRLSILQSIFASLKAINEWRRKIIETEPSLHTLDNHLWHRIVRDFRALRCATNCLVIHLKIFPAFIQSKFLNSIATQDDASSLRMRLTLVSARIEVLARSCVKKLNESWYMQVGRTVCSNQIIKL